MENVNFNQSLLSVILIIQFIFGFILVIRYIVPSIHLIKAPNREEREKKLSHCSKLENMSDKEKVKMVINMTFGVWLMVIAFAYHIYKGFNFQYFLS